MRHYAQQAAATRDGWLADHGLSREPDGTVVMFKAVGPELRSGWSPPGQREKMLYEIGSTVTAKDYTPWPVCGQGLHFGHSIEVARSYALYEHHEIRYLACAVDYGTLVPLRDKVKAKSCKVLHEVDAQGQRL